MYDEKSNQAVISLPENDIRITSLLNKYILTAKKITKDTSKFDYTILAKQNKNSENISEVILTIQKDNLLVKMVELMDLDSNYTRYNFKDIRLDEFLNDEDFYYDIPKNAKIIDTRE